MLKGLSTAGALAMALLAGCVDPKDTFADYGTRVVDAAPIMVNCPPFTETPDITGSWLFGGRDRVVQQMGDITFLLTIQMTRISETSGLVDVSAQPLDFMTKQPVGTPFESKAVPLEVCLFKAALIGTMPGPSNPISRSEVTVDAVIPAEIQTADFICGRTIEGGVPGFPLNNQDFAMIRVPDGAIGDALPETKNNCDDLPAQ
jgi:hypothetical protein